MSISETDARQFVGGLGRHTRVVMVAVMKLLEVDTQEEGSINPRPWGTRVHLERPPNVSDLRTF